MTKRMMSLKADYARQRQAAQVRLDMALVNVLTNIGVQGKDKRLAASYEVDLFDEATANLVYRSSDVAAKIVDKLPEEMLREGFQITVKDDAEATQWINEQFCKWDLYKKLEMAIKWARLFGGSGIIIGAADGQKDPSKPLNMTTISKIEYFVVVDRYRINIQSQNVQDDPTRPGYGMPKSYNIVSSKNNATLDASRLIRFDGVELAFREMQSNNYWGDSILTRIYNVIRDFDQAYAGIAAILPEIVISIFKMESLDDILASKNDELLSKRLQLVNLKKSVLNAVVVKKDEEFKRETASMAGVPEALTKMSERLLMAADMPHTILFGDSPSGLGATGESEQLTWYDHVKNKQESILRPAINRLCDVIFAAKDSYTNGKIPTSYTVEFNPLFQLSDKEAADLRKAQAETDTKYIDAQVLSADEVALNRFGNGAYSTETIIDVDARKKADPETEYENPNENTD